LISSFTAYQSNLQTLRLAIENSTTEEQILSLMNDAGSSLDLEFMVLGDSALSYGQANSLALQIQNSYQLINDTQAFVANHTTGPEYSFFKNKRKLVFNWPNLSSFVSPVLAAPTTGWTCRQYDRTDNATCASQLNLAGQPCFWEGGNGLCVGDGGLGLHLSQFDADEKACSIECDRAGLVTCYQGNKCAANGGLEEYVRGGSAYCGNKIVEEGEKCDLGTELNNQDCSPLYGSDGEARTCENCNADCTITIITGAACGDKIINGRGGFMEECDDGNKVDGERGDFCYNNCEKRYLDIGDTSALDTSLALLDAYKSDPANSSLDTNVAEINSILVDIYNVYTLEGVSENEKLSLLNNYQKSLESVHASTQNLINGVITEVENILSL
jgi:hypothetical protein